ncbi:hypothetical protein HHK36_006256 [Tetracentron sinense]|uniref:ENTH domain-containing protein n=1 Tax=Tetracentron sinense TaxID=13715 RepID=A0A835DKP7_TETSI|nr:hypothetical protein HHK36_006256 [Tetracentron sinense]
MVVSATQRKPEHLHNHSAMDFMKVIDQTVREIKREVNLKVLKVPEIEQKVLDATDNEPWGPHGSALSEIAQATKKITECQIVMNVLWTRLADSGRDWRHAYKALAVIEYLVGNGSEHAVDDITEHTFQISVWLLCFEFVEPNGKDMGINVRKKVETILALLNNKDKIQEVRNKAAANRDKYIGLSSSGITYKSSSASYGSSGFQSSKQYGGSTEGDVFKDSYKEREQVGEGEFGKDNRDKSRRGVKSDNQGNTLKKGSRYGRNQDAMSSSTSKSSTQINHSDDNYGHIPSQSSQSPPNNPEDDFDDFDPRGTSTIGSAAASNNQVDLFGESLVGDLMDAPTSYPTEMTTENKNTTENDLFADETFVSASPHVAAGASAQTPANVDLFASQPAFPSTFSSTVDFFSATDPVPQTETKSPKSDVINSNAVDPFAAVPLNSFDGSDLFGAFTSHTDPVSTEPLQNSANNGNISNVNQKSTTESKPQTKKGTFQVKSGIWADSLSRGLIDLNISAPKKVSLVDIGIVGGLSDGSDEKEKGPPSSAYMGRAIGAGSAIGRSGFTSTAMSGDDIFSHLSQQEQFGSFQK